MRFLALFILFVVFAVLSPLESSGQTVSNTIAGTYNFAAFNSRLVNVRNIQLNPIMPAPGFPWAGTFLTHQPLPNTFQVPDVLTYSVAQYNTMTNGNLTISNIWVGYPYRVTMFDYQSSYIYTNYFDVGLAGQIVDASTNQAWLAGAIVFPRGAQGPQGLAGTNGITWGASANQSGSRPASIYFVFPSPPYSSTSYPHGIITTN